MEFMEQMGISVPVQDAKEKCPFKLEVVDVDDAGEDIEDDDLLAVQMIQENDGGVLGKNLASGSQGASKTISKLYGIADASPEERRDTKETQEEIRVSAVASVHEKETDTFPFGMAAHHVIPGNAALKRSYLYKYMIKGESVTDKDGKSYTIKANIGYNVNGAHNGVWLVGNYAIRSSTSPTKQTWSILVEEPLTYEWCLNYVAAVIKKSSRQFHDVHTEYSEKVVASLNAVATILVKHQQVCEDCKSKTEIPPPFRMKVNLYNISRNLKGRLLVGNPSLWKLPWVTSDKWKGEIIVNRNKFATAYEKAKP